MHLFDTKVIVRGNEEDVTVHELSTRSQTHFTEIVLTKLEKLPKGKTIGKIKEHLASIYRVFLRENILELSFDNELLVYLEPKVLVAPFYKTGSEQAKIWKKEIDFDFGLGLSVKGFAVLRETASTSNAGFALFRRNRLIQGSGDETYRPEYIFERPNSFTYQRLTGELHLEGCEVSHTKDGFQYEEIFLELLKEELDNEPLTLLKQAEGYRARLKSKELKSGVEVATERTAEVIKHEIPKVIQEQLDTSVAIIDPPSTLLPTTTLSKRVIDIELDGYQWQITLELSDDPSIGDWVDLSEQLITDGNLRKVGIRLALAHPFMDRFE